MTSHCPEGTYFSVTDMIIILPIACKCCIEVRHSGGNGVGVESGCAPIAAHYAAAAVDKKE